MHCLPVRRNVEVADAVLDIRRSMTRPKPASRQKAIPFGAAGMNPEHLDLLRQALPFINRFKNKTFV